MTSRDALRDRFGALPPNTRYIPPLLVSRVVPVIGLLVLGVGLVWGDPIPGGLVVHLPVAVALGWLSRRLLLLGAVVTPTTVEVRGYLWDRRLERAAVVRVTDLPTVIWRDEQARERGTPVLSLKQSSRALPCINASHRSRAAQLRQLLHRGGGRRR